MSGYSRLISFATKFSLGYGLFLGAVEPPRHPKNLVEAQKESQWSTFGLNVARDVGIGLADDLAVPILAAAASPFIPGLRNYIKPIMGAVMAAGTGIAAATFAHDVSNFANARAYVKQNSSTEVSNPNLNPIDGFLNRGAGRAIRTQMTGIASPAAQAIMHQVRYNPVANFYSMLIRDHNNDGGEAPQHNPIRAGLITSNAVGFTLTALATPKLGFGMATLLGAGMGVAAGIGAAMAAGDTDEAKSYQGAISVAAGVLPLLSAFTTLRGLRSYRGGIGFLNKASTYIDKQLNYGAIKLGAGGMIAAHKIEKGLPGVLGSIEGSYNNEIAALRLYANLKPLSIIGAEVSGPGTWFSLLNKPMNSLNNSMVDIVQTAVQLPKSIASGAVKAGAWAGGIAAETVAHTAHPEGWVQDLALAHLFAIGPHAYHASRGIIQGTPGHVNHAVSSIRRRTHQTTSMPSNAAA